MGGLTGLGLALIFVFVFTILAFAAELTYVLWYRRRFQREAPGANDPEVAAAAAEATGDPFGTPSSKELLLYFICLRNQSRNERSLATVTPVYAFSPSAPGFPWPPGTAFPDAKPLPPPPLAPPLPANPTKWGDAYATEVLTAVAGREKGEAGEGESVGSAEGAAGKEHLEEVVAAEVAFDFEVMPSTTPYGSSRFYTPLLMSPLRGLDAGLELELDPEADGSASDEEGFLSSEEKPPAE